MTALPIAAVATEVSSRVLAFPVRGCPTVPPAPHVLDESERDCLNRLRWFALKSTLAPKPDFERACFLLAGEANVTLERYATFFFRALSAKGTRDMVFYRPGASAASEDEIWLLRLVSAYRSGHDSTARALIAWRVRPEARRWLRFLSEAFAKAL